MRCTESSTTRGRRRQRHAVRAQLDMLRDAENILRELDDLHGAAMMEAVRKAWRQLCMAPPSADEDPDNLAEHLRWSPVINAAKAYARAVIDAHRPSPPHVVLQSERIPLVVPR